MNKELEFIRESIWSSLDFSFDGEIEICDRADDLYVSFDGKKAIIGGASRAMIARAFFLFAAEVRRGEKSFEICQKPVFKRCGIMADMSRNGVMTAEAVKRFVCRMASLGYNYLMLYTEDTYEIKEEPLFGYMRGRYTEEELKDIDCYAEKLGVEIVPCIQTLAHLSQFLKWSAPRLADTEDILLIDHEPTYEFIENAIAAVARSLRSRRIHIGMDEAHSMGRGRYMDLHGYVDRFELMNRHLGRVVDICKKYGYEPMMWSDMYFRLAAGGEYYAADSKIDQNILDTLPNVGMVYWDYYHCDKSDYDNMIISHKRLGRDIIFGGGMNTWYGFVPDFDHTEETSFPALQSCIEHGIEDVMTTMWGDDGNESNLFLSVPQFPIYSEYCYRGLDCTIDDIKRVSEDLVGISYDDTSLTAHAFSGPRDDRYMLKPLVYSDIFYDLGKPFPESCDALIAEMNDLSDKCLRGKNKDNEAFRYAGLYYSIIALKATLRRDLRAAYNAGDKVKLAELHKNCIVPLKALYTEMAAVHESIKLRDYKPFGYEVIQFRYGGMIKRVEYVEKTVKAYLDGQLDKIAELEEKYIPVDVHGYYAHNAITPSTIF